MSEEVHKNHRERMRKRLLENGLENFADHEVLELLLYYAIPRGDVNPLAHRLLDEFGSLAGVLEASPADLRRIKGVGDNVAALLTILPPLFQRYQLSKIQEKKYDCTEKLAEYLVSYYIDKPREQVSIVLLDNSCRILRVCEIGQGSASCVQIDTRKLLQCVLQYNAASVVLAHNHPRGDCRASRADILQTSSTRELLKKVSVELVDHIIVAEDKWLSLASGGQWTY
ncbi:MAG: DNA repair protein RadC [Eubacteriales bacterium]|nr:DNA repair protein RadC [Eubacteriales bacterium]